MKAQMTGNVWFKPRNKWIVDVFTGEGWENYSCFRIFRGEPKLISGTPVTDDEYKEIKRLINVK